MTTTASPGAPPGTRRVIPVVERLLVDDATPLGIYRRLARGAGTFILESAEHDGRWDRWSFVGVRSSAHMVARGGRASWIGQVPEGVLSEGTSTEVIASALAELTAEPLPGLPPLTGGLVGALGWDTLYDWEPTLSREAPGELTTPDAALCLVSDMVAVDHHEGVVWLMSNAVNADNRDAKGGVRIELKSLDDGYSAVKATQAASSAVSSAQAFLSCFGSPSCLAQQQICACACQFGCAVCQQMPCGCPIALLLQLHHGFKIDAVHDDFCAAVAA